MAFLKQKVMRERTVLLCYQVLMLQHDRHFSMIAGAPFCARLKFGN